MKNRIIVSLISFVNGFTSFPKRLLELTHLRKSLIYYALGALTAASSISLLIFISSFFIYLLISSFLLDSQLRIYLLGLYQNIVATIIMLVLGTGWWYVYKHEEFANRKVDILTNVEATNKERLAALDYLNTEGELARGRLRGETLRKLNAANYSWNTADLQGVTFLDGDLSSADFSKSVIEKTTFRNVDLRDANFSGLDMTGVELVGAKNAERIKFNIHTKLPSDSNNKRSMPFDSNLADKLKQKALDELEANSSDFTWRKRLWCRFTKETRRIDVPSEGTSEKEKQLIALKTKYNMLIDEFGCTSSNAHIYATAYVNRSIWFPAFAIASKASVYSEYRDKYWSAHLEVLRRGIKITRIFVIEKIKDLELHASQVGSETVLDLILRQDREENLRTGICFIADLNRGYAADISSANEDLIIFDDKDNFRCYILSGIGAPSGGSIMYSDESIRSRLIAFQSLFNNANYIEEIRSKYERPKLY